MRGLWIASFLAIGCQHAVVNSSMDLPLAGAARLTVHTAGGHLSFAPGASDTLHVDIARVAPTEAEARALQVTTTVNADEAIVAWNGPSTDDSVSFAITAPPTFVLNATTFGGDVRVDGFQADLALSSGGGHIIVSGCSGNLMATTGGGSLQVLQHSGDAVLHTGGGSIEVSGATSNLSATTDGGDIYVRRHTGSVLLQSGGGAIGVDGVLQGRNEARTGGGSVDVSVPTASNLTVSGYTDGGSASDDFGFPVATDSQHRVGFSGVLGSGQAGTLQMTTGGGSVSLHRLD